jgi:uncharacterized OB-fold protein
MTLQSIAGTSSLVRTQDNGPMRFIGARCTACGLLTFPPRRRCTRCAGKAFIEALIEPIGELYSYTVVRLGRPDIPTPYAIAVADFPEGVRVLARILNWEDGLVIGQPVMASSAPPKDTLGDPRSDIRLLAVASDGTKSSGGHSH